MIFVCAGNTHDAHRWCQNNGVLPHARSTLIVTPRSHRASRGRMLTNVDRVVVVGDFDMATVVASLAPCGLGTVVEPEYVR